MKSINKNILYEWKDKLFSLLFYIGVFLFLELFLHIVVFNSISPRIIYAILFALVSGSILYGICSLFPEKVNKIIGIVFIFVFVIYYEVQLVYHCIFGSFMPISQMTMGADAVTNFFGQVIHAITQNLWKVIVLFLPFPAAIILFFKKIINPKRLTLLQVIASVVISLALSGITMITLHMTNTTDSSAYAVLVNENASTETCVHSVGMAATTLQETRGLFNSHNSNVAFLSSSLNNLNNDDKNLNKDDIDFHALANSTQDKRVFAIDSYLANMSATAKNKYTGIAEGYNLITICAESFSPVAISEELTPTLYKLSNNGFVFKNFYNCFPNTTTNGEYSFVMGLLPNMSRTKVASSFDDSIGNYLPYTLGNVYSELGLPAKAYHNYYATFYDRTITHKNMGYDFKAVDAGLDIDVNWPSSDLDMINASTDDYINSEKPFHAYYMTFSGHYQYNWDNAMSAKNKDAVASLPYSEAAKAYIACNLELEYALQSLMARLEKAGKADQTVIVLTGDHYPYGLSEQEYNELAGYEVDTEFEKYHNSFICYVPGMQKVVVEDYCSTPDILPTILNIMGIKYDSRLLAGKDVLSDAPHIAVLADQSFITKDFKYNASTSTAKTHDGGDVDPYTVQDYYNYVSNMFTLSNAILDTNYYSHVFNKESEYDFSEYISYKDIKSPFTEAAATFMVTNGYMEPISETEFGTKGEVTMSEFTGIIYKMAGSPIVEVTEQQPDMVLAWAQLHGIIDDQTLWNEPINQVNASHIMYNYVDIVVGIPQDTDYDEINELCAKYKDVVRDKIIAMKWCKNKNVIHNLSYNKYNSIITREKMAVCLQRMYFFSTNK